MKRMLGFLASLLLVAGIAVCLLLAYAFGYELPRQVERAFGPPAAGLGTRQRLLLAYRLTLNESSLRTPANPGGAALEFEIPVGETPLQTAQRLKQAGLVKNAQALVDYLVYTGLDTRLQAGKYQLNPGMTPLEIANSLQDATPTHVTFRILPGWRIEEVADALPTSGLRIDPDTFLRAARKPSAPLRTALALPEGASLEGYLFPDAYEMARTSGLDDLLHALTTDFNLQVNAELRQAYQAQGLSLHEAVTLASIVQREAMVEDEMPTIASVFLNRLADGMKLDSDPTVQYALGFQDARWWKSPLALDDLSTPSPYNTYQIGGLPPGPICSPGLPALQAVAFPAQTPYYYFRAACDGSGRHNFARSFEEHQQNACP